MILFRLPESWFRETVQMSEVVGSLVLTVEREVRFGAPSPVCKTFVGKTAGYCSF